MASHRQSRTSATGMSGRPEQPVTNLAVGPPREQPSNLCWAGLAGNGWACTESGSQPLVARKPGRRQGGGTRGYIRWTADAIWIPGPPRWVILAVLLVVVAVAVVLIILYAGGGSGGGGIY